MTLKILTINIIINGNIVPCIVKASLNINMRDTSRERMLSDHKSAVFHHPRSTRLVYGTYPEKKKPRKTGYFLGFKNPSAYYFVARYIVTFMKYPKNYRRRYW